jgi:hypothetical protein
VHVADLAVIESKHADPALEAYAPPNAGRYGLSRNRGCVSHLSQPIDSETGTTTKSKNPYYISKQLQDLVLADESGEQRTFALSDFNATASEGDRVILVSASPEGQGQSTAIALRNETTGESFFSASEITKLVQPTWLDPKYFMPIVVACILTLGMLFAVLMPCMLIAGAIAKKRTAVFIERLQFE